MYKRKEFQKTAAILLSSAMAVTGCPVTSFAADLFGDGSGIVVEETAQASVPEGKEDQSSDAGESAGENQETLFSDGASTAEAAAVPVEESYGEELFAPAGADEAMPGEGISGEYIYGTVSLPYADFYYGELNTVSEKSEMNLAAADPVAAAGYRDKGMYDAVTTASTGKSKRYDATYYNDIESGVSIEGIKDVNIAVPKTLYDDAAAAIREGKACSNRLLTIVGGMTVLDTVPSEYKVLNGDGTLGRMVTEVTVDEAGSAAIITGSVWGSYQISVKSDKIPTNQTLGSLMGVILETGDGKKYGLEHLENLWLQPQEMAFAVKDFTEPHGNTPDYRRFEDIQGKIITKITYLVRDGADVEISTNLLCKVLVDEYKGVMAADGSYSASGSSVKVTLGVPKDSSYQLAGVSFGGTALTEADYKYENGVLTILGTENTGVGQYTLSFQDSGYADISGTFVLKSDLEDGDVVLEGGRLVVKSDTYDAADYLKTVSALKIDGAAQGGRNTDAAVSAIFGTDGTINFDAYTSGREGDTYFFQKGKGASYEIEITSNGFPAVKGTVTSPLDTQALEQAVTELKELKEEDYSSASWKALQEEMKKAEEMLAGTGRFTQEQLEDEVNALQASKDALESAVFAYAKKSAVIYWKGNPGQVKVKLNSNIEGTITYSSSNTKAATVGPKGVVTARGRGSAVITAKCGGKTTSFTVTVKLPGLKLPKTKATIYTKGSTTVNLKAVVTGIKKTVTYTSSDPGIAIVGPKGVVKAKKPGTVTITAQCGAYKAVCRVTVKAPTLKLEKSSASVEAGKKTAIKAAAVPQGTITYRSSDPKIATVGPKGVVTGVKKGTAKITVACNGVSRVFTITVK